jgi:hypothetical protein
VAVGILSSRLVGLVRQRVVAHYFGLQTDAADAWSAGFRIPNFLQNLFGEGALSASFIPVYAALVLSGHTHGGQIWPFRYLVRLSTPYVVGHFRRNGSQLYVSRGTGFWGPAMRLFAPGEITEIVIRNG